MIGSIIAFIVIFGVVVIAHELGHFLLAKKNGIKVVEFSVGMGPTILKFEGKETRYSLKLFPIGGACMFEGEDGIYSEEGKAKPEGSFQTASVWARFSTVLAGPIFNLILAFLLSLILVGFSGSDVPIIADVTPGYPAAEAGIEKGDIITRINGERVYLYREVSLASYLNKGEPMKVEFKRDGQKQTVNLVPQFDEADQRYYLGFRGGEIVDGKGFNLLKYGYYETRYAFKSTWKSLVMLVQGKVSKDDLAGPVGIAIVIDDVIEQAKPVGMSLVILQLINIAVLLSVNLGILNLLPLPALDGGRLVFLLIEAIRGKPVAPEKEGMVHFIGFVLLMILMVFVLFNDLSRLF